MESIGEILKKKRRPTNTSKVNTDTWLNANQEEKTTDSVCQLCKGAGFIYPITASGKPDFSRVVPCRCTQGELQKKRLAYLEQYSNLGSLSRFNFDNLQPTGRYGDATSQQHFASAYKAAKDFAHNPRGWLILLGRSGCGKTHLACAIANYRLSLGQPAFYIGVADLLDHLRSAFNPNSDIAYDQLFEQVKNTPLLILDDLSIQSATPWAKERLEQLLNYRFNSQLPTVITTDIPLEEFEERLRRRLNDTELCQVCIIEERPSPASEQTASLELPTLRNMTFKNFDYRRLNLSPEQRQNLERAYHLAFNFAQSPQGWLVFQGTNGCGKTHLAAAIANYQVEAGKPVLFIVVPELFDHLRSTFSPESKVSYDELFERVKKASMLILDDFGEQSTTPWVQEKLYQLINYRYNARLPTVITTCFSLDEIEDRISSRMGDPSLSTVWNITAPDYRIDRPSRRPPKQSHRH